MKIGGSLAFWVKIAIGGAALYVLWQVYRGVAAVGGVFSGEYTITGTDATKLPGYTAAQDRVYDPTLDSRTWWERLAGKQPPPEAFRPRTERDPAA